MVIKKWKVFSESLVTSLSLGDMIKYLKDVKKDKVAKLLWKLKHRNDPYPDSEDLNFIGLTHDNMFSFLPNNRRTSSDYNDIMSDSRRISLRIGRGVRKIVDKVKPLLMYKGKIKGKIGQSDDYWICLQIQDNIKLVDNQDVLLKLKFKFNDKDITIFSKNSRYTEMSDGSSCIYFDRDCIFKCSDTLYGLGHLIRDLDKFTFYLDYKSLYIIETEFDIEMKLFEINDHDIEIFTNEILSLIKTSKSDESSKIEIVEGDEIVNWYDGENYQSKLGKLGNSCMSPEECRGYFKIYTKNPNKVKLLILKNKNNKLIGRALLWKLDDNTLFMDRVYTAFDSDDNIFINYAIENGYTYRGTSMPIVYYKNGEKIPTPKMECTLDRYIFTEYPYVDTLKYLKDNVLYNYVVRPSQLLNEVDGTTIEVEEGMSI
jgi:hypothetical protein